MAEIKGQPFTPIYLDHHATTPMDPRVIDAMVEAMRNIPGNPNSVEHHAGWQAVSAMDRAREQIALLVGCERDDVHFATGASDGIRKALAVATAVGTPLHVAAMAVEHPAMLDALGQLNRTGRVAVTWLQVDERAQLSLSSLDNALAAGAQMICLMAANNEVGTIYPVEKVLRACREAGAALLVDATQAAGRMDLCAFGATADFVILSGHKIYGPKGIGALIAPGRRAETLRSLNHSGTPNVAAIVGLGVAAELARTERIQECAKTSALRNRLQARLMERLPRLVVNGDVDHRLPNALHISIPGVPNDALVARVGAQLAISTGAACASGAQEPSHVLRAMGLPASRVESALRLSTGRFTTEAEIDHAVELISAAVGQIDRIGQERIAC